MRLFISRPQYRLSVSSRKIYDERNEIERRGGGGYRLSNASFFEYRGAKKKKKCKEEEGEEEGRMRMTNRR